VAEELQCLGFDEVRIERDLNGLERIAEGRMRG
jgi:hypothetical protein